jgi:hypothetical protein
MCSTPKVFCTLATSASSFLRITDRKKELLIAAFGRRA